MSEYILEMDNISKTFPGVKALDSVNFKVKKGEIHCLVGENGAGKSTLMKVLSGVYPHGEYSGRILYKGNEQRFTRTADSQNAGIAIIYQELSMIPELTVYENIFMGREIKKGFTIDWNETIVRGKAMLEKVKLNIHPDDKAKDFGVGVQQLIEIAKALSKNVELLILDEPTSALSETDSANLLNLIRELKTQGVTSIMISHKLREVISIADTITVLRDGRTITSIDAAARKVEESEIIRHMVGREIGDIYPKREKPDFTKMPVRFELRNWNVYDPAKGRKILYDVNLNVRQGEIVGIAGLIGAGRTELALSAFGNHPKYDINGEILVNGCNKRFNHPRDAIKAGVAYVSEDRKGSGLNLIQDIKTNTTFANLQALARFGIVNNNEEVKVATKYFKDVNIKAPSIEQIVGNLSGGNQQKVSVAKWMFVSPKILILDEPTRGIDVGAKFEIYTLMNKLVEQGMCIIMISSELLEVIAMSDRIYVLSEGRITGEISGSEATEERIMEMATV